MSEPVGAVEGRPPVEPRRDWPDVGKSWPATAADQSGPSVPRDGLPCVDPATGRPWDAARIRHWADWLEAFAAVSAWLGALADAVEASEPSAATGAPAEAVSGGSGHTERQASDDELTRLRTFTAAVDQMLGDMDAAELRAEVHRLMETREEWLRQAATVWEPARFALLVNERDEAVAEVARLERERDNACAMPQHAEERLAVAERHGHAGAGRRRVNAAQRDLALAEVARYRAAIEGAISGMLHTIDFETERPKTLVTIETLDEIGWSQQPYWIIPAAALGDGAQQPSNRQAGWMGPPDEFAQTGDGA